MPCLAVSFYRAMRGIKSPSSKAGAAAHTLASEALNGMTYRRLESARCPLTASVPECSPISVSTRFVLSGSAGSSDPYSVSRSIVDLPEELPSAQREAAEIVLSMRVVVRVERRELGDFNERICLHHVG